MKIPLIMREQYQGQLLASMLYILLCGTGFMTGSFFVYEGLFFIRKTKKHRNCLRCQSQNGDLGRTRTCDLLIRSQTLYPTELQSHISVAVVSSNNDIIAKSTLLVNTFLQLFFRFFADSFFFGSRLMFFQPTAVNEEAKGNEEEA